MAKHETAEGAFTYGAGAIAYLTAKVLEHKHELDTLAQVAHDVTVILACAMLVGRAVFDAYRILRWLFKKRTE